MKNKVDICGGPIFSSVIRYTVPVILTNILQLLYNAADMAVVGRFCGSASIAAVGATGALTSLLVNVFIGLSTGAGVVVAHSIGAKDSEGIKKAVHTSIAVSFFCGIIVTLLGVFLSESLLKLMGTPADILPLSALYMKVYFGGMMVNVFCFFAGAVINATGQTQKPLIYLSLAGVTNVILNIFFVTVFKMNVEGVALATVLSQLISASLFLRDLLKRNDDCRLFVNQIKIHKAPLLKILGIGIPSGLQGSFFSLSNTITQSAINSFGSTVVSGNAAASSVEGFIYTSMNAFSQTTLTFTGQNMGAGKPERIKKTLIACCASVTVLGIVMGAAANLFGGPILSIFITDSNEAISVGLERLLVVVAPYFLCGIMECLSCANRGLHHATASMIISVFFACIFRILWVNTMFTLPQFHSLKGLLVNFPISWFLCIIFQLVLFIFSYKKLSGAHRQRQN